MSDDQEVDPILRAIADNLYAAAFEVYLYGSTGRLVTVPTEAESKRLEWVELVRESAKEARETREIEVTTSDHKRVVVDKLDDGRIRLTTWVSDKAHQSYIVLDNQNLNELISGIYKVKRSF